MEAETTVGGRVAGTALSVTTPRAIVAADVDGTLREPGAFRLEPVMVDFLRGLMRHGVLVVPSSGRGVETLIALFGGAEVLCPVFAGENGGHVTHYLDGKVRNEFSGDMSLKRRAGEHIASCKECDGGIPEEKRRMLTIHFGSLEQAREKAAVWREHLGRIMDPVTFTVMVHADGAVDFVPRGISKRSIVGFLKRRFPGVPTITVGDGENDRPMLESEGVTPVCPSIAHPDVVRAVRENGGRSFDEPCPEWAITGLRWALRRNGIEIPV